MQQHQPKIPTPSRAAAVWLDGDVFHISFPPMFGEETGHHVTVLMTHPKAWLVVLAILRAREASERSSRTIGHKAAPIQYETEKMTKLDWRRLAALAENPVTRISSNRKVKANDELTLEDLGL